METIDETLAHVFVNERVLGDVGLPAIELYGVGEFAVEQQVRHFEIGAVLGELLDGVTAMAQDARIAVEIGDRTLACSGLHVGRVVDIQRRIKVADGRGWEHAVCDWNRDGLAGAVVGDGNGVGHVAP